MWFNTIIITFHNAKLHNNKSSVNGQSGSIWNSTDMREEYFTFLSQFLPFDQKRNCIGIGFHLDWNIDLQWFISRRILAILDTKKKNPSS